MIEKIQFQYKSLLLQVSATYCILTVKYFIIILKDCSVQSRCCSSSRIRNSFHRMFCKNWRKYWRSFFIITFRSWKRKPDRAGWKFRSTWLYFKLNRYFQIINELSASIQFCLELGSDLFFNEKRCCIYFPVIFFV